MIALIAGSNSGCYLLQSARGQLSLMARREPIDTLIAEPSTPAPLRERLSEVRQIRRFASVELGLPDNGSYRSYADLGRPYAVWNVVAAPEFSLQPKTWCYPVAGCVAYRGYFAEGGARAYADRLRRAGLDVSVEGVAAYSTLGHFDDPVLNTMVGWSDTDLAAIIFHELTHQLIYVAGDSSFDEALATTVEEEGLRRWLRAAGRDAELGRLAQRRRRILEVVGLLEGARAELASIYASDLPVAAKRARKRAAFDELRRAYAARTAQWGAHPPFADWFAGGLDNARLASIATYYDCVPGFERELARAQGDLGAFYRRVRTLADLPKDQRDSQLCAGAAG